MAPRSGVLPSRDEDELTPAVRDVGIPYDEWNVHSGRYRRGWVSVLETRAPAAHADSGPIPPEIAGWFRRSPDRAFRGPLEEGTDLDPEAYIDEYARRFSGEAAAGRIYASMIEAPRDVVTGVLLDASASLQGHQGQALATELACADALAAALSDARERHAVWTFSGDTRHRVDVRVLRDFDDEHPIRPSQADVKPSGYTRLGAPLRHVTRRLLDVPARRRILLAIGDGLLSDEGYEGHCAEADVHRAMNEAIAAGVVVFYIGVGAVRHDPLPRTFGPGRSLRVTRVADLAQVLAATHDWLRE